MSTRNPETLSRLVELVERLRAVDQTMNMNELMIVMRVAEKPGIAFDDICESIERDVAKSTVSRLISRMGDGAGGKGFMVRERGIGGDLRNVSVWLTPKGQKFIKDLTSVIE